MWIKNFICNTYQFKRDFHLLYNRIWTITDGFLVNNQVIDHTLKVFALQFNYFTNGIEWKISFIQV